jgi:hypothetical protein
MPDLVGMLLVIICMWVAPSCLCRVVRLHNEVLWTEYMQSKIAFSVGLRERV